MAIGGDLEGVRYELGRGWVASGWVADPDRPDARLNVEIVDDNRVVVAGSVLAVRDDRRDAATGGVRRAFSLPLGNADLAGDRLLVLSLRVNDGLLRANAVFRVPRYIGHVDGLSGLFAEGWACDTADPGRPVFLELLIDGQVIERVETHRFRHDLAEQGLPGDAHGFQWLLPRAFVDGRAHRLAARVANGGPFLGDETEIVLRPQLVTPALKRLYYLRETARQHLLGIDQALHAEGRKPAAAR